MIGMMSVITRIVYIGDDCVVVVCDVDSVDVVGTCCDVVDDITVDDC
jgi:hypothetical protein